MSTIDPSIIRKLGDDVEQDSIHVTSIAFKELANTTNKQSTRKREN